jgi:D-alanine--poly(phosphoribitol) ligase subunit 1
VKDLIELIHANVAKRPKHLAVIDGKRQISYEDFWKLCNAFSSLLLSISNKPKIAFVLNQSIESYAFVVASFNVGATYCPISPEAPLDRKLTIIDEFNPNMIVVDTSAQETELKNKGYRVEILGDLQSPDQSAQIEPYSGDDLVYIIYTSGSTGKPKGVMICRKAVNKFLEWSIPTYATSEKDVWAQFSSLSFDLSIVDILTCLCSGATLFVFGDAGSKFRPSSVVQENKITIWHSIPSAVDFMIRGDKPKAYDLSSLRIMSFCGETLHKYQVEFLFSKNKNLIIFNTYGPTEGTLFCSWQEMRSDTYLNYCNTSLSIGKPIPGWDFSFVPVEGFEEKEIIIYGDFIGKGYTGNVNDNKYKEIEIGGKLFPAFETSDLVNELDGNLFFAGRKDRQVKIKGYRIELDEIDYWSNFFTKKLSFTVVKNNRLVSFIECENGEISEPDLRAFLVSKIEPYKIPNTFIFLKEIPRNANLKINVNALIELAP